MYEILPFSTKPCKVKSTTVASVYINKLIHHFTTDTFMYSNYMVLHTGTYLCARFFCCLLCVHSCYNVSKKKVKKLHKNVWRVREHLGR